MSIAANGGRHVASVSVRHLGSAGLHIGEIERRTQGIGGIGAHIAARVMAQASPGCVFVTRTVRDLVTGTDLGFRPVGSVSLKGVPGEWERLEASVC